MRPSLVERQVVHRGGPPPAAPPPPARARRRSAQVDRRQVKAEHRHRAAQLAQLPRASGPEPLPRASGARSRDRRRAPRRRRRLRPRPPGGAAPPCRAAPGRSPRAVHRCRDGAPVGLVAAVREVSGERSASAASASEGDTRSEASELRAELVQLVEVKAQRPRALHRQRLVEHPCGDEGLPSRSPPIQLPTRRKGGSSSPASEPARRAGPRGRSEARQPRRRKVASKKLSRWPPRRSPTAWRRAACASATGSARRGAAPPRCRPLPPGEGDAVARIEQAGDRHLAVEDALARDLGGWAVSTGETALAKNSASAGASSPASKARPMACAGCPGRGAEPAISGRASAAWCWSSAMLARCEK